MRLKERKIQSRKAQTLLEYSLIFGLVTVIILAMGPMIGRSSNGFVRLVVDQIGLQNNAEQNFDPNTGYLEGSLSTTDSRMSKERRETTGVINYIFDDVITGTTNQVTGLGIN